MNAKRIQKSLRDAELRFSRPGRASARKQRSDAGGSRLPDPVASELRRLLSGHERPPMREVQRRLRAFCEHRRLPMPSRATLYNFMSRCRSHDYRVSELPTCAQKSLYNLDAQSVVPGHQLAFYAFNYGDLRAICLAAGLPWLDLYQAVRMRGWRPKSLGLLRAVLQKRGI